METVYRRVIACLETHRGSPRCGPCVALEVGATRCMVYEVIRYLLFPPQVRFYALTRERARCRSCVIRRSIVYLPETSSAPG